MVSANRRTDPVADVVEGALAAEGLSGLEDREKVAETLEAVLDSLRPAPSSPLDAGIRRRMREAAARPSGGDQSR